MAKKLLFNVKDLTRAVVQNVRADYGCDSDRVSVRWVVSPGAGVDTITCVVLAGGSADEHNEFNNEPTTDGVLKTMLEMNPK